MASKGKWEPTHGSEGIGFDAYLNRQEINVAAKVEELLGEMDFYNAWAECQFWIETYDQSSACKDLAEDWRAVARIIRERQAEHGKKSSPR